MQYTYKVDRYEFIVNVKETENHLSKVQRSKIRPKEVVDATTERIKKLNSTIKSWSKEKQKEHYKKTTAKVVELSRINNAGGNFTRGKTYEEIYGKERAKFIRETRLQSRKKIYRKVIQCDLDKNELARWDSLTIASLATGIAISTICTSCKTGVQRKGFYFMYG